MILRLALFLGVFIIPAHFLVASWDDTQRRIAVSKTLGDAPEACQRDVGKKISEQAVRDDERGTLKRVIINSCGNHVVLYTAIPKRVRRGRPLVIALHQTANLGKDEVMGLGGDTLLGYGKAFFDSGYIVIAPDIFLAGENYNHQIGWDTINFYRDYPRWSSMGRMLRDNLAVSRFAHNAFSPGCTAAVGHSLGAHNALFLAAFDRGIDVVVSSAGFESIAQDRHAERWARDSQFVYMPLLRPYVKKPAPRDVPWDFDDVLSLVSPRPVLVVQGKRDDSFDSESALSMVVMANDDYDQADKPVETIMHAGGHEFGPLLQNKAIRFVTEKCHAW